MTTFVSPLANQSSVSRGLVYNANGSYQHSGMDMGGRAGDAVAAMASGRVVWAGYQGQGSGSSGTGYGKTIIIQHYADGQTSGDKPKGNLSLYSHLSEYSVALGESVEASQTIGVIGNTGRVFAPNTGVVLHIEIMPAIVARMINTDSSTSTGIPNDSLIAPRLDPFGLVPRSGNAAIGFNIDNQSGQSNNNLASGLSSSGLWNGISTPGKVSIFDGFNDDLFTPYNQGDLFRSLSSIGGDRYNLNGGWSGLSSSNSYLDGFTFNMGGSTYTLFGEDGGISLSSGSGSAYGGYNWQSDYDLFGSGSYGGGSGSRYFRPTTTMYNGLSMFGSALNHYSPLAIDLDGDGIETQHIYDDARVYFDIDNDGFAERVGWIKADDGMLALDRDGNGTIDNVTELFGDWRMEAWDELKLLDSNNDDKITAADTRFNELKIWRDLNQNGVSEAGELKSLSFYNITQINITHNSMDVYQKENYISGSSTVTYGNGITKTMYDVHFLNDNVDTWFKGAQASNDNFTITIAA